MDGLNFSPRNMQQLINNILKDASSVMLTTTAGDQLVVHAPIELGTDSIAFKPAAGDKSTTIVPYHAIQRLHVS